MPLQPPIPDKAGRGALCAQVDALMTDIRRVEPHGSAPDPHELKRLFKRLDGTRNKLHRLYGVTPSRIKEG